MALTPAEITQANPELQDFDGTFAQFTRSAVLAFIQDRLSITVYTHSNKLFVELKEEGVLRNAENFGNFGFDPALTTVDLFVNGSPVSFGTLDSFDSEGEGVYSKFYLFNRDSLVSSVNAAVSFVNPTTANNPTSTVNLNILYQEVMAPQSLDQFDPTGLFK